MGFFDIFKAAENQKLKEQLNELQRKYDELSVSMPKEQKDFEELERRSSALKREISKLENQKNILTQSLHELSASCQSTKSETEQSRTEMSKIIADTQKLKSVYEQYKAAIKGYEKNEESGLADVYLEYRLRPFIEVDLNCLSVKALQKRYQQNRRKVQKVFAKYEKRYTTKSNQAIYALMVIAMEAELQNVLTSLSHGKLEKSLESIRSITERYYEVAVEGNQNIAPTMKPFIAEIEYLFTEAVNIEYEYYVKKEQEREEQRAIREQMRQETEDRKRLEAERKKVEQEESKYTMQIEQLTEKLQQTTDEEKIRQLEARIAELQIQIAEVQKKKDEIINLQNGKAGYVYVISNLGSFGKNVFKVGMTRRLDPMERVTELGSASVPFPFDVHSFIFSEDAVSLENTLHKELNQKRVNKVNLRKEFFNVSLDELEKLVLKHDPTAEFRRTMLAEQYYQSLNRKDAVLEIQDYIEG